LCEAVYSYSSPQPTTGPVLKDTVVDSSLSLSCGRVLTWCQPTDSELSRAHPGRMAASDGTVACDTVAALSALTLGERKPLPVLGEREESEVEESEGEYSSEAESVSSVDLSLPYESMDWYDDPIYYDIVFQTDTLQEADFLEATCRRWCMSQPPSCRTPESIRMLEPAAGSGRLTCELARRGYSITGFDINENILRFAKERASAMGVGAVFCKADMIDFDLGEDAFDCAFNLVSSFKWVSRIPAPHARGHSRSRHPRTGAQIHLYAIRALGLTPTLTPSAHWGSDSLIRQQVEGPPSAKPTLTRGTILPINSRLRAQHIL